MQRKTLHCGSVFLAGSIHDYISLIEIVPRIMSRNLFPRKEKEYSRCACNRSDAQASHYTDCQEHQPVEKKRPADKELKLLYRVLVLLLGHKNSFIFHIASFWELEKCSLLQNFLLQKEYVGKFFGTKTEKRRPQPSFLHSSNSTILSSKSRGLKASVIVKNTAVMTLINTSWLQILCMRHITRAARAIIRITLRSWLNLLLSMVPPSGNWKQLPSSKIFSTKTICRKFSSDKFRKKEATGLCRAPQ